MGLFDLLSDLFGGGEDDSGDDEKAASAPAGESSDGGRGGEGGRDDRGEPGAPTGEEPTGARPTGLLEESFEPPEYSTTDLPDVDLEPGMDLDEAHERAVSAFEEAGYHVTPGNLMNSVGGPADGVAKLFNFQPEGEMHTGVVYTGDWSEDDANAVLNLVSGIRTDVGADGLHIVSPVEPPETLQYLTGTHPRGAFAMAAMVEVQNGVAFTPESVPRYADVGRDLLAEHLEAEADVEDLASLELLDDVVLTALRRVDEEEQPFEGYEPREALMTVGALAGEVMRNGFEAELPVETEWTDAGAMSSTGVALSVERTDEDEGATVNPVGKTLKLYRNGATDSLVYMYQTSRAVLTGELG